MRLTLLCLFAAVALAGGTVLAAGNPLTVEAKETTAELAPQIAERRQIPLPALDVAILASLECPAETEAASLTVSVSDTHRHYGAEQLVDTASVEAVFNVPANQLAPFTATGFCSADDTSGNQSLELPGIATAQASLRCRGDDDATSVYFASAPISVRVYCLAAGEPDSSSAER